MQLQEANRLRGGLLRSESTSREVQRTRARGVSGPQHTILNLALCSIGIRPTQGEKFQIEDDDEDDGDIDDEDDEGEDEV